MNRLLRIVTVVFCCLLVTGSFYSCRTTRPVSAVRIKPLSTSKILKNLNEKPSGFDQLSIKRINCQISGSSVKNTSFKASLKLIKDSKILVSFSKMNIAVGRILLTPDSVKYVNYLDKQYFKGDYEFVYRSLNVNIDFQDIQAILFNNFFTYYNNPENSSLSDYDSFIDSGLYVLRSVNNRKLAKFYEKRDTGKGDRYQKRKKEDFTVVQSVYVEPETFNILKIEFEDSKNNRKVQFDFGDFSDVDGREYPGSIDMMFQSDDEKIGFNIRMNGFSIEKEEDFDLKIPDKYVPVVFKK